MKLEGKTALVTGGAAGIGQGIVRCLAEEGADVAIADVNRATSERLASEVRALGRKAAVIIADVTKSADVDRAVQEALQTFGRIDILVNNAGGESRFYKEKPGEPYTEQQEFDDTLELNLRTTVLMTRAMAPHFVQQRSGKIVNISSIGGRPPSGRAAPAPGMSGAGAAFSPLTGYAVAKAGVIQFTYLMALQLAEYNINVNSVCPGVLYTPLYERSAPRRIAATPEARGMTAREFFDKFVASRVPLKREQTPEDIGRAVVFLASEDARNITGQSLNVDGGMVPG